MNTLLALVMLTAPTAEADTCEQWGEALPVIAITESPAKESSGLAASRDRPGVLFTHDDRNGPASLFAFDTDGNHLGIHSVKGATNFDWEDLAAAPCPDGGNCLYIGDIGDNGARRTDIRVYIVPEPAAGEDAQVIRTLRGEYPDGPRDAESLLVHPCTGEILILTKDDSGPSVVYRFPEQDGQRRQVLEEVGPLLTPDDASEPPKLTGADFNLKGDRAIIRSRDEVWVYDVDPQDPLAHWDTSPERIEGLSLNDSEGITFSPDGDLLATSEGAPLVLAQLPCADLFPSSHTCLFPQEEGCNCSQPNAFPTLAWLGVLPWLLRRRQRRMPGFSGPND